jgi:hypothetical protein
VVIKNALEMKPGVWPVVQRGVLSMLNALGQPSTWKKKKGKKKPNDVLELVVKAGRLHNPVNAVKANKLHTLK